MNHTATLIAAATAVTATAAPGLATAEVVELAPTQSFFYSQVIADGNVDDGVRVKTVVGLGEDANARDAFSQTVDGTYEYSNAIANIHNYFVGDVLHTAGTSHGVSRIETAAGQPLNDAEPEVFAAFYHEVRTAVDAVTSTILNVFVAAEQTNIDFDRALLASLEIRDADDNLVDIDDQIAALNADATARALEIELAPGQYLTTLRLGTGRPLTDDEFHVRHSVVAAPTPSAAVAGLLGLGALCTRRRKQA